MEDHRDYEEKKEEATVITINDVKKKSKKARVPVSYLDFLDLLKMYANTLFSCFVDQGTMGKLMESVIKIIHGYRSANREQLFTMGHKANILWIIHMQGREWATGNAKTLKIFTHMTETLKWKKGLVQYTDVPKNLYTTPNDKKKKLDEQDEEVSSQPYPGSPSKAQKKGQSKTRDARLEVINEAVTKALAAAPDGKTWVPISAICQMCSYWPTENGNAKSSTCAMYMLLGACDSRKCKRQHMDMPKDRVPTALDKYRPFLEDPTAVWKFVK